jgi:hypothetical protein
MRNFLKFLKILTKMNISLKVLLFSMKQENKSYQQIVK